LVTSPSSSSLEKRGDDESLGVKARVRIDYQHIAEWREYEVSNPPPTAFEFPVLDPSGSFGRVSIPLIAVEHGVAVYV
jgi:hypothetical protein